jgi:hypothetical protein
MALETTTQLPDDLIAIIMLQLTFGGAPCPFEWGIILETVCDLANKLLKCEDWEPQDLHASVQTNIPPRKYLSNDIPFTIGRNLIVDIPIDPRGYTDVYINNMTGLTANLPGTMNADRLEAAIALAIKVAAQPNNANEPIPCKKMVAKDKLTVEGTFIDKNHSWMAFQLQNTHRDPPRTQTHPMVAGDPTDDPDAQYNKQNTGINNGALWPCQLHDPLFRPLPQPPQITACTRLEQEDHKY